MRALIFTYHRIGPAARKGSMVFRAERLAALGWETRVVTVQLSWLSRLAGVPRLRAVDPAQINRWHAVAERLAGFVWVPPIHPATVGIPLVNRLAEPLFALYPWLLPRSVRHEAQRADLIVVDSASGILLADRLRRLAPRARMIYWATDRLGAIGMHPMIERRLRASLDRFDAVNVFARAMLDDFAGHPSVTYVPQAVDKAALSRPGASPYAPGTRNAVVAGDMMFDRHAVSVVAERFADLTIHAFGGMRLGDLARRANVVEHGEVPFAALVPYMAHADIGLAPFADRPDARYLVDSSLKLKQYSYCRLPIVAPAFCKGDLAHLAGYAPGDAESIAAAVRTALAFDRAAIDPDDVPDWDEAVRRMLATVGLAQRNAAQS